MTSFTALWTGRSSLTGAKPSRIFSRHRPPTPSAWRAGAVRCKSSAPLSRQSRRSRRRRRYCCRQPLASAPACACFDRVPRRQPALCERRRTSPRSGERARPGRSSSGAPGALVAVFAAGVITALAAAFFADRLHAPQVAADGRASAPVSADIPAARAIAALMDFRPQRAQERANASGAAPNETGAASNQASLIVPNLSSAGFTLVGMRPAPARSGEPENQMFCLFYAKAPAAPVALCIARDADGGARGRIPRRGEHCIERVRRRDQLAPGECDLHPRGAAQRRRIARPRQARQRRNRGFRLRVLRMRVIAPSRPRARR